MDLYSGVRGGDNMILFLILPSEFGGEPLIYDLFN